MRRVRRSLFESMFGAPPPNRIAAIVCVALDWRFWVGLVERVHYCRVRFKRGVYRSSTSLNVDFKLTHFWSDRLRLAEEGDRSDTLAGPACHHAVRIVVTPCNPGCGCVAIFGPVLLAEIWPAGPPKSNDSRFQPEPEGLHERRSDRCLETSCSKRVCSRTPWYCAPARVGVIAEQPHMRGGGERLVEE
jgi:hypothetical protein